MKKIFLAIAAMLFSLQASARNDVLSIDIQAALDTPAAQQKLNKGVKFYFGKTSHPKVKRAYGEVSTSKKTNAFGKSDIEACQWVFLSAMIALQDAAVRQGANAVVDIKSNYQNNPVSDKNSFQCGAGNILAGVALKGKVVKLR